MAKIIQLHVDLYPHWIDHIAGKEMNLVARTVSGEKIQRINKFVSLIWQIKCYYMWLALLCCAVVESVL